MSEIIQRVATKALIVNDGQVLILREANTYEEGTNIGRYGLPGGRVKPGEAWEDALKREVREETGLDIEIGQPLYVGEWRPIIKGVPHQIVAIFFRCKALGTDVRLSDEHDDYQWADPTTAAEQYDFMPPDDLVITAHLAAHQPAPETINR